MTKMHYEWLAWSIRQVESDRLACPLSELGTVHRDHMESLAKDWAYQCQGTNPMFKRDRFISAVVDGEW